VIISNDTELCLTEVLLLLLLLLLLMLLLLYTQRDEESLQIPTSV
jgi:hypothetical protein